jgi:hypothetical protein
MEEGIEDIATSAPPLPGMSEGARFMIKLLVGAVVVALAVLGSGKVGLFAPAIGTSLNEPLTNRFKPILGQASMVFCPSDAKFYAGALIVCGVANASTSIFGNVKFIDVSVMTQGQYRVLPVSGP